MFFYFQRKASNMTSILPADLISTVSQYRIFNLQIDLVSRDRIFDLELVIRSAVTNSICRSNIRSRGQNHFA